MSVMTSIISGTWIYQHSETMGASGFIAVCWRCLRSMQSSKVLLGSMEWSDDCLSHYFTVGADGSYTMFSVLFLKITVYFALLADVISLMKKSIIWLLMWMS